MYNLAADRASAEIIIKYLTLRDENSVHLLHLSAASNAVVAPATAIYLKTQMRSSRVSPPNLSNDTGYVVLAHIIPEFSMAQTSFIESVLSEAIRSMFLMYFYPAGSPYFRISDTSSPVAMLTTTMLSFSHSKN